MESCIWDQCWPLRTNCYVLWINELACYISKLYEPHLQGSYSSRRSFSLYGRYSRSYHHSFTTSTNCQEVLRILRDNDLFLKPEKCIFHADEVKYLGMIVGKGQIRMDPAKITAIRDWPTPTNKQE